MVILKSREEIELMRQSALVVSKTLGMLAREIKPGVTTLKLDQLAEEFILDHGTEPGFKGQYDYKYTLCTSVNDKWCMACPPTSPLEEGDIVSIDCGALKNGFYGDHAYTFEIGEVDPDTKN